LAAEPTPAPLDATTAAASPHAASPGDHSPRCLLRTDGRFHAWMQAAAVAVLSVLMLAIPQGEIAALSEAERTAGPWLSMAAVAAGMIAQLALHEGAHALVFRLAGLRVEVGALVRRGVPLGAYCRSRGPVPCPAMLASLLAPQIAVPAVLLPLGAALGRGALALAMLLCAFNVAGSVGDAAFLAAILRRPAAAGYLDREDGLFAIDRRGACPP
jgi:hypothetical protein